MIGMGAGHRDGVKLANYLEHGEDGKQTGRIKWALGLNGMPDKPTEAAPLMNVIADRGGEIEVPIYHMAIACHPGAEVSSEEIESVLRRTLNDVGLHDYPAVILEHQDKEHRHGHMMVCRRDYDGNTWSMENDFARIEESLRKQEVEREWPITHGRLFKLDEGTMRQLNLPSKTLHYDENLSVGAFRYRERALKQAAMEGRERLSFYEEPFVIQARVSLELTLLEENLDEIQRWDGLLRELESSGYYLKAVSRGLVITNGAQAVAASHVSRFASLPKLEARFGDFTTYLEQRERDGRPYTVPAHERLGAGSAGRGAEGGSGSVAEQPIAGPLAGSDSGISSQDAVFESASSGTRRVSVRNGEVGHGPVGEEPNEFSGRNDGRSGSEGDREARNVSDSDANRTLERAHGSGKQPKQHGRDADQPRVGRHDSEDRSAAGVPGAGSEGGRDDRRELPEAGERRLANDPEGAQAGDRGPENGPNRDPGNDREGDADLADRHGRDQIGQAAADYSPVGGESRRSNAHDGDRSTPAQPSESGLDHDAGAARRSLHGPARAEGVLDGGAGEAGGDRTGAEAESPSIHRLNPESVPVKGTWDEVFATQDRFEIYYESIYSMEIADNATGDRYHVHDPAFGRELLEWSNEHWRSDPDTVYMRLASFDQHERDCCSIQSRLDAVEARAFHREWAWREAHEFERLQNNRQAEAVARTRVENTVKAHDEPEAGSGSVKKESVYAVKEPEELEKSAPVMAEITAESSRYFDAAAIGEQIKQAETTAAVAQEAIGSLDKVNNWHENAFTKLVRSLEELYGGDAKHVLTDLLKRHSLQERGEAATALRGEPNTLAPLHPQWSYAAERPEIKADLERASYAAAANFMAERRTHTELGKATTAIAAAHDLRPNMSVPEMKKALDGQVQQAISCGANLQKEVTDVHLPVLAKQIREKFESLPPTERGAFLRANPQIMPILNASKTAERSIEGGKSRESGGMGR